MIIIGEKINATRKVISKAIKDRDDDFIIRTATKQAGAGADYIDINGGDPRAGKEADNMAWLADLVQSNTDLPLSVDTADPEAARKGLSMAEKKPILNSVSLETERLENMLGLIGEFDCMVIALLMDDSGVPCAGGDRVKRAETIIEKITSAGKKPDEIIIDPCVLPVSTDPNAGRTLIADMWQIRDRWPDVHIGGGLSNISYGLPNRRLINITALAQAIMAGMDAAIIDPCTPGITAAIYAAEAMAGRDDFCMNYLTAAREGKLD